MDESFLLMLSNLLHLHNNLDPTTSLLSATTTTASSAAAASSTSLLSSSSAAPLFIFTIASVLSYVVSSKQTSKKSKPHKKKQTLDKSTNSNDPESSKYSIAAFRALSTERIWQMDASLRDSQWRSLYGISYPVFTTVVDKLKPYITASNLSLPSDYAVAMVLSRLCHGYSAQTLASRYALEPYLVSKITNMVTRLLATKLYPEFIKIPVNRKRIQEATLGFEELTSLPNICGAIDGSAIKVTTKSLVTNANATNMFKCRYGYDSILLQVVADHNKIFWDVCVKAPGGSDDATHLRDSLLYNRLISDDIVWDNVINVRGHHLRPYIIGDWCYPLLSFLLTPFTSSGSCSESQNLFNEALMKGRSAVVDAIGLLKGRWRILQDLNVGLNHAPQTIVACCVLHNLCQIAREPEPELWKEPEESGPVARVLENEKSFYYFGESMRQILADNLQHELYNQDKQ